MSTKLTVVGIDVGGARKGFHAVAHRGGELVGVLGSFDADEISRWCCTQEAVVVAVDAPCAWSIDGRARAAEKALMSRGIFCYATPTRDAAINHPLDHFRWMLNGEALYASLRKTYEPFRPTALSGDRPLCAETYPHAVTCALAGQVVSARRKSTTRRALLAGLGFRETLPNIDWVDAAVCALAADAVLRRDCSWVGEEADGYIVVPGASWGAAPDHRITR